MANASLKEQQRQLRREIILKTALALFIDNGYSDTSMDDIAANAGISKATLYQDFSSKDELTIHAVILDIHESEKVLLAVTEDLPAIDKLEQVLRIAIERRIGVLDTRILMLPKSITTDPRFREPFQRMSLYVSSLIDEAKRAGDISQEIPTPLITQMINSIFQLDYESLFKSGNYTASHLSDMITAILFHGIAPLNARESHIE